MLLESVIAKAEYLTRKSGQGVRAPGILLQKVVCLVKSVNSRSLQLNGGVPTTSFYFPISSSDYCVSPPLSLC